MAALRLRANDNSPVQTLGYFGPLTGGAGVYDPDSADMTSADNGGTVLIGAGGIRYKLRHGGQVSPRQFGCVADGVADDRPALQSCLVATSALKISVITAPQDTYLLKSFSNSTNKAVLYVYAFNRISGGGTVKVDISVGPYKSLFLQAEFLTDIRFGDLIIDCGNYPLTDSNPVHAANDSSQENDPRRTFDFASGTSATFTGTTILNWTGVQLFTLNLIDRITIDKCSILNAGVGYYGRDFDSSVVYANGTMHVITNNLFSSGNVSGVRTCIEVHGKSSLITGNIIRRFKASFIVASDALTGNMQSVIITNNFAYEIMIGLYVWAVGGIIKALTFKDNIVTIDRSLGGLPSLAGGMLFYTVNTFSIGILTFNNNNIEFLSLGALYAADDDTDGVAVNANNQVINQLFINSNTIINSPAHGISVRFATVKSGTVTGNQVVNTGGYATLPDRAGVNLVGNIYGGPFSVVDNVMTDSRATTAMTHGVLFYGVAGDNAANLRVGNNTVRYAGAEAASVGVNTTAPILQSRGYSINRPGIGPAYSGNFAEGSTVTDEASGAVYRQVTAGSGSRWVLQKSERMPADGQPAFRGDRHTEVNVVAGGVSGLICITDGVRAQTPWAASTAYYVGQFASANAKTYYCNGAGTSGTVAPSHTTGTVANGSATFLYYGSNAEYRSAGTLAP